MLQAMIEEDLLKEFRHRNNECILKLQGQRQKYKKRSSMIQRTIVKFKKDEICPVVPSEGSPYLVYEKNQETHAKNPPLMNLKNLEMLHYLWEVTHTNNQVPMKATTVYRLPTNNNQAN